MDASIKAWRLCYRLMDRNANTQDHTEASLKDMEWPWPLPLEEAVCLHSHAEMQSATSKARRDGLKRKAK